MQQVATAVWWCLLSIWTFSAGPACLENCSVSRPDAYNLNLQWDEHVPGLHPLPINEMSMSLVRVYGGIGPM